MDYTKDHKKKTYSLLMEKWGYGKMEEVEELEEGLMDYVPGTSAHGMKKAIAQQVTGKEEPDEKVPKNVQAALDKIDNQLKSLIGTIDDPKEVNVFFNGLDALINTHNPQDYTDAEKKLVLRTRVKNSREKLKATGKQKTASGTQKAAAAGDTQKAASDDTALNALKNA